MTSKSTKKFPREKWYTYQPGGVPDWPIIWNMGKVGSNALNTALVKAGINCIHAHYLGGIGEFSTDKPAIRHTFANEDRDWRFLILVRDPIARNISAWFRNIVAFPNWQKGYTPAMKDDFLYSYSHAWPRRWFELEPEKFLQHRFIGKPFNTKGGFQPYRTYEPVRSRTLILRTDKLSKLGLVIGHFLRHSDGIDIPPVNTTSSKSYGWLYEDVKREFRSGLPSSFVQKQYASEYARTFFSQKQLEKLTTYWTGT